MKAIIKNSLLDALSRDRLYDLAGVIMDFPETNPMLSLLKDKWLKFPILLKRLQWLNRQCFSIDYDHNSFNWKSLLLFNDLIIFTRVYKLYNATSVRMYNITYTVIMLTIYLLGFCLT